MKAAIIGGGVIGGGWAARFLLNGWDVAICDPAPDAAARMDAVLDNARMSLPMLYDVALPPEGRLIRTDSIAGAVRGADWVQESVPERLDLKHRILGEIGEHARPDAVIGSSTSGFKPSDLNAHGARAIVAHPFNPVYLLPLVELVGAPEPCARAADILRGLGMFALTLRAEIDAHIADRLLEAVWREALWLVHDGLATTTDIDDAIRMGFGLRWAQMGLFETYRIAGGDAGMRHFLAQFGPALKWPWTKLMDVPELSDRLIDRIAAQSDAQAAGQSIRDLERRRDGNLVALLRALKARGDAAGAVIAGHEAALRPALPDHVPVVSAVRVIPTDWTDYNGHMNEGRYGQLFSDAADAMMAHIGADAAYIAAGQSYFTVETTIRFRAELKAGDHVTVESRVTEGSGKRLGLGHRLLRQADGQRIAEADQLLIHVDLATRRAAAPPPAIAARVAALAAAHADAP